MSILWCGGEDIDFQGGAAPTIRGALSGRSSYERTSFASFSYMRSNPMATGITSGWASCFCGFSANYTGSYFGFGNFGENKGLYLGAGSGVWTLRKHDGSSESVLYTSTAPAPGGIYKFDLQLTSYGAAGTLTAYVNGIQVCTYTGDISLPSVTDFKCIACQSHGVSNGAPTDEFAEFIIADEDTRAFSLVTLYPNAAGDANAWTGAYTDIDESTLNDADMVYSNTGDADMQVNLSGLPTGVYSVKAVMASARAYRDAASTPDGLALGIRNGTGGSLDYGVKQTLSTSWTTYNRLMTTNPVTAAAWAVSEIAGLQLNLRAKT